MNNQSAGYGDVVVGLQYGDEGKARVVDDLAGSHDIVARFNGGANAGHTVEVKGQTVALKQVPSGIFYEDKLLYVGSGCAVNVVKLYNEIEKLEEIGIDVMGRMIISGQAGLIQPHHVLLDGVIGGKVGTTLNGIGPAYADRAYRMWDSVITNIRMGDLVSGAEEKFYDMMLANFKRTQGFFDAGEESWFNEQVNEMKRVMGKLGKIVEIDPLALQRKVKEEGKTVIFEGAQAFMLDVNKGTVPYVTSSTTAAPSAYVGGDLPPNYHRKTIGVAKVIMSRVGHGPFVSEFGGRDSEEYCMSFNEDGSPKYGRELESEYPVEELLKSENPLDLSKAVRILSGEYGTVTTRPRRVGAIDFIQLKYAAMANGINEIVLTKCDLLNIYARSHNGKIPVVTAYELDGEKIDFMPSNTDLLYKATPVIEYREAFSNDISGAREAKDLPAAMLSLIEEVEQKLDCKVSGIGVGPNREQFVRF